eukprot:6972967-Prymnesium_polylepis.4
MPKIELCGAAAAVVARRTTAAHEQHGEDDAGPHGPSEKDRNQMMMIVESGPTWQVWRSNPNLETFRG